jgi:hypothetical protein
MRKKYLLTSKEQSGNPSEYSSSIETQLHTKPYEVHHIAVTSEAFSFLT